jgi:hypothetical protein
MQIKKAKLIEQLKKRKSAIVAAHKKQVEKYNTFGAKFKTEALEILDGLRAKVAKATTMHEIRRILDDSNFIPASYMRKPPDKPQLGGVAKALYELELCEDDTLSLEASRNYLNVLRGEYDECDTDEDDEYDDE